MTDLEISKALALAIGWEPSDVLVRGKEVRVFRGHTPWDWQFFDYRDWNVIGPIATKYNMFPCYANALWWTSTHSRAVGAYTPQKAIALAVIGEKK